MIVMMIKRRMDAKIFPISAVKMEKMLHSLWALCASRKLGFPLHTQLMSMCFVPIVAAKQMDIIIMIFYLSIDLI